MRTRNKKYYIFLIGIILSINTFLAQSIPNSGFETWTTQQQVEIATGWIRSNTVSKTPDAHDGQYAAAITAGNFTNPQTGDTISLPGRLVTGIAGAGMGQTAITGFSFSERPDSLIGWFQYATMQPDNCIFNVTLSKWNPATQMRDIIGEGQIIESSALVYNRFSLPVIYLSNETPDTCVIEFLSSPLQSGIQGSILKIDDVDFVYNSNAGLEEQKSMSSIKVYPNPVSENGLFNLLNGANVQTVELLNSNGIIISRFTQTTGSFQIENIPAGTYFLRFEFDRRIQCLPFVKL